MPHETGRYCCEHCGHRIETEKEMAEVAGKKLHKKCKRHFKPPPKPLTFAQMRAE